MNLLRWSLRVPTWIVGLVFVISFVGVVMGRTGYLPIPYPLWSERTSMIVLVASAVLLAWSLGALLTPDRYAGPHEPRGDI
jgi:hypothetical protein